MTFRAPVRDIAFALQTVGHPALLARAFPDVDDATVAAVLEAAGSFVEAELAPLNRRGDLEGARYENGRVTAAPGFAEAYKAFAAGGWNSLSADPEFGGQGLSKALELSVFEMVHAANMAFGLCPMLTLAAIEALAQHGTERQKRLVLPKLVSGEWTGAMCLTEPQAGSDLAALTTVARPDGKGGYRLHGQKIFITWGDHDAADNICHLVIARTPDAPPGVKGISLFLTSKFLLDDDGVPGARN
ncbi:MAG: acyl-CoA dehydrogenase family protein, partial [Phenylobacterium sp.]|nr:acyl-CoA dehydrogenase family protein [Phenylobacterium sp.]